MNFDFLSLNPPSFVSKGRLVIEQTSRMWPHPNRTTFVHHLIFHAYCSTTLWLWLSLLIYPTGWGIMTYSAFNKSYLISHFAANSHCITYSHVCSVQFKANWILPKSTMCISLQHRWTFGWGCLAKSHSMVWRL